MREIENQDVENGLEARRPLVSDNVWGHPNALIARSRPRRAESRSQVAMACFRSDDRFFCRDTGCKFRTECIRLVADWKL